MTTTERRREIASMGGKAAHAQGKAHEFEKGSELARAAGRKAGAIHAAKMAARRAGTVSAQSVLKNAVPQLKDGEVTPERVDAFAKTLSQATGKDLDDEARERA